VLAFLTDSRVPARAVEVGEISTASSAGIVPLPRSK
jgi:hypothetical protein